MGDFPLLHPSGLVEWTTDAAMRSQWPTTLGRGALVVRSQRKLLPLEVVDVVIELIGQASISARAEVVVIEPERTMLRLVDGPIAEPRPAPVNPFATRVVVMPTSLTPMPEAMPPPDLPAQPDPFAAVSPSLPAPPPTAVL